MADDAPTEPFLVRKLAVVERVWFAVGVLLVLTAIVCYTGVYRASTAIEASRMSSMTGLFGGLAAMWCGGGAVWIAGVKKARKRSR